MHEIGFKTFNSIIDESYDNEHNIIDRFEMAFEQIKFLGTKNYHTIMQKAQPILDHNYQHLISLRQKPNRR